jgi:hypothetical protein
MQPSLLVPVFAAIIVLSGQGAVAFFEARTRAVPDRFIAGKHAGVCAKAAAARLCKQSALAAASILHRDAVIAGGGGSGTAGVYRIA